MGERLENRTDDEELSWKQIHKNKFDILLRHCVRHSERNKEMTKMKPKATQTYRSDEL